MNYAFAVKWLKAFRTDAELICTYYADDFLFEDLMFEQSISSKADLERGFAPYANTDRTNGIGVHNFRIRGYEGDERSGLIRWEWTPEDAAIFLGLDVKDKPFWTQGHTFHVYNEEGKIVRESSWWDAAAILRQVGAAPAAKDIVAAKQTAGV